jgi:hypothetical protein
MANGEWIIRRNPYSPFATHYSLSSHRPDFDHVGQEMPQEVLDAML